ncbi:MAG: hydrolase [Treponemataceae bacterium]
MKPTRIDAEKLWRAYNDDEALWRHALSVEAVMRHFALKAGGDPDEWGVVGLIHDIDYGCYPTEHCVRGRVIMEEAGWPESYIRAMQSHGWGLCVDVEPKSAMEKTLYAVDELTGFIAACALVRPSKSLSDLEVKSVKKKWKMAAFASGVNRDVIEKGAGLLGVELDSLINETILALRPVAAEIGLAG